MESSMHRLRMAVSAKLMARTISFNKSDRTAKWSASILELTPGLSIPGTLAFTLAALTKKVFTTITRAGAGQHLGILGCSTFIPVAIIHREKLAGMCWTLLSTSMESNFGNPGGFILIVSWVVKKSWMSIPIWIQFLLTRGERSESKMNSHLLIMGVSSALEIGVKHLEDKPSQ